MAEARQVETDVLGIEHMSESFFSNGLFDNRYVIFVKCIVLQSLFITHVENRTAIFAAFAYRLDWVN